MSAAPRATPPGPRVEVVRPGIGANCSSLGSAIDIVFLASTAGVALYTAVVAALGDAMDPGPPSAGGWRRVPGMPALARVGGERPRGPLEVHLAVTGRCTVGCAGCYTEAHPDGAEPSFRELCSRMDSIAAAGAFVVAFGGGEPTTRSDLGELAEAARERGLSPVVTTSGLGLSPRKRQRLRAFDQVNVSYDGPGNVYATLRPPRAAEAEEAVRALAEAGVRVGVNVVLTRASYPSLEATVRRARELGAREAQLLRLKPAGRAARLDYLAARMTPDQRRDLAPTLRRLSLALAEARPDGERFGLRIDCALVPFLASDDALYNAGGTLEAFGVLGCEAARHLGAVTVTGEAAPCSFAPAAAVPFGAGEARVGGARNEAAPGGRESAPEPCGSCRWAPVCRGGCRVVSALLVGDPTAPDPECPRVEAP